MRDTEESEISTEVRLPSCEVVFKRVKGACGKILAYVVIVERLSRRIILGNFIVPAFES